MNEWQFLDEWFRALRGDVRIYDPSPFVADQDAVRLGRDGEDDELWLNVRVRDDGATTAAQRTTRCQTLHEALVLTSLVAVVDYDAWREALRSISELGIPAAVDPDASPRRVQPQYRLQLPTEGKHDWSHVKQIIAGDESSDRFVEHLNIVQDVAARRGVSLDDHKRFRVCVYDCPMGATSRKQVARLRALAQAVVSLREIEESSSHRAKLRLDSVSLSLQNFAIHSTVFREILAVIETGVEITQLGLPFNFPEDDAQDEAARCEMWSLLVSAICGRPQRPTGHASRVRHLVLSSPYDFPEMLVSLLSVLGEACALKSLKVSAGSRRGDPDAFFWLWLGYALFRSDSRCSVEVLDLDMVELSTSAINNLRDGMSTPDSLRVLWQKTTQTREMSHSTPSSGQTVVVAAGTTVRPYGDEPGTFLNDFTVPVDWSGVIVHDDSTETTIDALLYGIGFCEIDRASLPNKRQRADVSLTSNETTAGTGQHNIRTLKLGVFGSEDPDEATPHVDELLDLVGAPLTSLSLSDPDIDGPLFARCLEKCPDLHSLHLEGCRLTTMDPIIHSYDRGGKISSLELSAIQVQPAFLPRFEAFLSELLVPSAMKRTFKKLRIGHQWAHLFRQSTANVIKQVLDDPLTLDYLHVYRCENPRVAPSIDWDVASHQGEIIPVRGIPPLAVRAAFAGVVKHLRTVEKFARLDNDMLAPVFEYVGQTKKRVVISEANTYYNSRMFGFRQVRA